MTAPRDVRDLIRRKRDGGELSADEIAWLVSTYTRGGISDHQMSAFLMAVCCRGMTEEETFELTRAMIGSGETMRYPGIEELTADKHSTGGVGDKVSIALAPWAAAAGLYVPMLSGRGLGHTGGTLDKLESIPGFRTRLDAAEFEQVLRSVGCVMGGQSGALAPADGKIYALRDATGTVESQPLIISSILSKKIAAGPRTLVLDVKVGRGAFIKTLDEARALAEGLVRVSTQFGQRTVAFLTDMDVPLGRAIGNGLEVVESIDLLRGDPVAADFAELTRVLTAAMLVTAGRSPSLAAARATLDEVRDGGSALAVLRALVTAQGGSGDVVDRRALPAAPLRVVINADTSGFVEDIEPMALAGIVLDMGGGRRDMTDTIDPAVGIWLHRQAGEAVTGGDPLIELHLPLEADADTLSTRARAAVRIGPTPRTSPLIFEVIGPKGTVPWQGWETRLPI
jgi:pyrimidine-nucleoside phosphorylase